MKRAAYARVTLSTQHLNQLTVSNALVVGDAIVRAGAYCLTMQRYNQPTACLALPSQHLDATQDDTHNAATTVDHELHAPKTSTCLGLSQAALAWFKMAGHPALEFDRKVCCSCI